MHSRIVEGYYVVGSYTSVAWFKLRSEAERCARQLNYRGGTGYTVEPCILRRIWPS